MKQILIFLAISLFLTSSVCAQTTKQAVDKELQKALEAEKKAEEKKKKKKEAPLFTIETSDKKKAAASYGQAKKNLDISVKNLATAMSAIFPGAIKYDYTAAAKKADASGKTNLMEILPGDFEGAKILMTQTSDYKLNRSEAMRIVIKSNDQVLRFLNKGYREIATKKAKVSAEDIIGILNQQLDLIEKFEKVGLDTTARYYYSRIYIYSILLDTIINTFYTEQNLITTEIKKEVNIIHDPTYYVHDKSNKKLSLNLNFIRKDFDNIVSAIKFFITQNKNDALLSKKEKTLNHVYVELRSLDIELNIIKTRLKLYNVLNHFDIIYNSPLTKKIIRIKDMRIKQSDILETLKNQILRINNIYNTLDSGDVVTALENIWNSSTTLEDSFLILGAYSIIEIISTEFSDKGYFHKNFKELSYFKHIKKTIENCALEWDKKKYTTSFKSLLESENIFLSIDLDTQKINLRVALKEENITSPFLKYFQDYRFEISAGNDTTSKTVSFKIGSFINNQFSAVEITKTSPLDKKGFDLGFDLMTKDGETTISSLQNNKVIKCEKRLFGFDEQNNRQQIRKVFSIEADHKSSIDVANETISGNGSIIIEKTDLQTDRKTSQTLTYNNSTLRE